MVACHCNRFANRAQMSVEAGPQQSSELPPLMPFPGSSATAPRTPKIRTASKTTAGIGGLESTDCWSRQHWIESRFSRRKPFNSRRQVSTASTVWAASQRGFPSMVDLLDVVTRARAVFEGLPAVLCGPKVVKNHRLTPTRMKVPMQLTSWM